MILLSVIPQQAQAPSTGVHSHHLPPTCVCPPKTGKDKAKMNRKAANARFIVSSLKHSAGFYQQILSGASSFQGMGKGLVKAAEIAQSFRRDEQVEEIASALCGLPIREFQLIGQYYLGWCAYRRGENARSIFENIIEKSDLYRAKALWSLAAVEAGRGDFEAELKYFNESLRYAADPGTLVELYRGIAIVKAKEGFHQKALKDLEGLGPMLHYAKPRVYYDCLNSLAVELGVAGRAEEARNICKVVLGSPFAPAYSEWRETAEEVRESSRSFVALNSTRENNVVCFTPREATDRPETTTAKVLKFDRLREEQMTKKKSVNKSAGKTKAEKALEARTRVLVDDVPESSIDLVLRILEEPNISESKKEAIMKILETTDKK